MKTKYSFLLILSLILLVISLPGCKEDSTVDTPVDGYTYSVPEETNDGWQTASLSSVGINTSSVENLVVRIKNYLYTEVHSVIIIKNDKLVFEEYFPGHDFYYPGQNFHGDYIEFDRDTRHNTHSVTKSFTSAVVGLAVDKGFIQSIDYRIADYFSDYSSLFDQQKNKITIKHMLTMSSGLQWNEWDVSISQGNHDIARFNQSSDPVYYLLSKPVVTITMIPSVSIPLLSILVSPVR